MVEPGGKKRLEFECCLDTRCQAASGEFDEELQNRIDDDKQYDVITLTGHSGRWILRLPFDGKAARTAS